MKIMWDCRRRGRYLSMVKLFLFFLCLMCNGLLYAQGNNYDSTDVLYGDVNSDGIVNVADIVNMVNGSYSATDIMEIVNIIQNPAVINIYNLLSIVANSGRDKEAIDILNSLPKGLTRLSGQSNYTMPFISFHDDDAIDKQIPVSYRFGSTPKTRPSAPKGTGFASFLYVFTRSIIERHRNDIKGKLVFDIAAEGQRIGLLENLYSDEDKFDGNLNFCGEMIRKLHDRCGWGIMCHTMTARYIANSYLVESINDPLVAMIETVATDNPQNSWKNSYIHCEDSNLDYEYRHGSWHIVSDHYLRPYLAKSLDADAPLYFNPRFSSSYQFGEWKSRASIAGLPFMEAVVYPGRSACRKHIIESMEYYEYPILGQQERINKQPLDQTCVRRFHYHPKGTNAWTDEKYNDLIRKIDECIDNKSWLILTSHAYDEPNKNYYVDGVDYGSRRDDSYPEEWIVPLKQVELETIDENNYWEVPPGRLGISSWAEWYPCPGTTYDMLMHVIEYAIERGVEFGGTEEGLKRFGNKLMLGLKYPEKTTADKRLANSEFDPTWWNYLIKYNDGSVECNVQ